MGLFSKSKEEKENEEIAKKKRENEILYVFKILLESDTITIIHSLIQDYISIFSLYSKKSDAQEHLKNELQYLFQNFTINDKLEVDYIAKNAQKYYNINSERLIFKLNLQQTVQLSESRVSYNFLHVLYNNIDSIIDNQNLFIRYIQSIENKDAYEKLVYTIVYLMTIPVLIVSIYSKILNYKKLDMENKDDSDIKDLLIIIENISNEQIESKEIIDNIYNINLQLFKNKLELTKFDFYIYILLIRKNALIKNFQVLIDKTMMEKTNTLLESLNNIQKDSNTLQNIENIKKEYINSNC